MRREPDYSTENKMVVRNDYVYARHPDRMSIQAMRLMRIAITQCRKDDTQFYEYTFNIPDLAEMIGCNTSNLYREADEITTRLLQVVLITGTRGITPKAKGKKFPLFYRCQYDNGRITLQLHPDAEELFLRLGKNNPFTQIPIATLLLLRSKYGIRLFEIICQKAFNHMPYANNSTTIQITIQEVRQATGTENQKTYDKISHLKSRIVMPALEDIEQAAEWRIISADIKHGRKITGFELQIWSDNGYRYIEQCKAQGKLPE